VTQVAASTRVLDDRDLPAVRALLARDPVGNVFVASRIDAAGLDRHRLGAQLWGFAVDGRLAAVCHAGANLVPVGADADAAGAFADRARRSGRACSSLVGPAEPVLRMWELLRPGWGPARDVRPEQPLLAISGPPRVPPDPAVRRVRPAELDLLLPACIAMYAEEVGVSPLRGDGGAAYRARVAELVATGRAFARIEGGRVLFKAEIGAVTRDACQIQGVWVEPRLRGGGFGTVGTAGVVAEALRSLAPTVSLYVNGYNRAARRAYEKVGFTRVGTFASVLF
jgi:predicted GNAT family acetyltransferase